MDPASTATDGRWIHPSRSINATKATLGAFAIAVSIGVTLLHLTLCGGGAFFE
jgi:hypothetical protein